MGRCRTPCFKYNVGGNEIGPGEGGSVKLKGLSRARVGDMSVWTLGGGYLPRNPRTVGWDTQYTRNACGGITPEDLGRVLVWSRSPIPGVGMMWWFGDVKHMSIFSRSSGIKLHVDKIDR